MMEPNLIDKLVNKMVKDPWNQFQNQVFEAIKNCLLQLDGMPDEKSLNKMFSEKKILKEPQNSEFGDISTPISFIIGKILKQKPIFIANTIKNNIKLPKVCEKVEVENGHLNFYLNWSEYNKLVLDLILKEKDNFATNLIGVGKKVIVEHTSANPNKPLHLGTMRNAVIGDITARIFKKSSFDVEVENYMDDLGRQIAVIVWKFLKDEKSIKWDKNQKPDFNLGLIYVDASSDLEQNPQGEDEVKEIIKNMEFGEEPAASKAKEIVEKAVFGQLETSWRMNIFYDILIWESDVIRSGIFEEAITEMLKSDKVYKLKEGPDAGCIIVDMAEFGEKFKKQEKAYKIIVRSNNVATYTGRDIGLHFFKLNLVKSKFFYQMKVKQPNNKELWETSKKGQYIDRFGHADKVINVIGVEQDFPQQVVFHAIKIMGYEDAFKNSHHLKYEHVWLPDQKFSGRKGTWIGFHADAALDKAVELALKEINVPERVEDRIKRGITYSDDRIKILAEKIGVGAVKYYLAKYKTDRKITIKWEDVLNFEGDSCPYIQYAYVRARAILEKSEEKPKKFDAKLLINEKEKALIKHLSKLPSLIKDILESFSIHLLPEYVLQLADAFTDFYHACPVLKAETKELKESRLNLVNTTKIIFEICFKQLLGIDLPEKM
ncbi:MAG: arginine--tRNA ligase [Candidatus Lokiarchaeota archaeon]|nr:arginine--tRNA ligase [Candidatus Lokiarchaeota archaeon]